jgi:hypothetical protein
MAAEWQRAHRGKRIFSDFPLELENVWSIDPPGDVFGEGVVSLADVEDGLLLIDEAHILFNARLFGKTPANLLRKLTQHRKYGLELWWSSQQASQVDKMLRELTTESYHPGSLARLPKIAPLPFLWPGFFVTIRAGLKGKSMGTRYVRRTVARDSLYETMRRVGTPDYLT